MLAKSHLWRLFIISLLLGLQSGCLARPDSSLVTGTLTGKVDWQGTVLVRGDVLLADEAELTIAPGTRVLFLSPEAGEDQKTDHPYFPGSELIVRGQLTAVGTAEKPILFQAAEPNAEPGSWGAINIEDSVRAVFQYCRFQQADSAIHARRSWVSIEHSHFVDNLVGIRFHDTDILIEKNLLERNGAAIRFHFGAPVICKNLIRNNGKGLFITSAPWGYTVENNSFIANHPYQVSLGEGVQGDVELPGNFWGEGNDAPERGFYDGRVDDWLGTIHYRPLRISPNPETGIRWNR